MAVTPQDKRYSKFIEAQNSPLVPLAGEKAPKNCTAINVDNPRSVVNLLPTWLKCRVLALPEDLLELTEPELVARIYKTQRDALKDRVTTQLRIQFWEEYDRCQRENTMTLDIDLVTDRVCTASFFVNVFTADPHRLMYLLTPPTPYTLTIKQCLLLGIDRMYEVLSISPVSEDGSVNDKLADIQHRMFQTLDQRLNGAIAQTINQRNLNVNVDGNAPSSANKLSIEQIQERIRELEAESKQAPLPPASVHVDLMSTGKEDVRDAEIIEVPSSDSSGVRSV